MRGEIASALRLGRLVIPLLAEGAPALEFANLPPGLAAHCLTFPRLGAYHAVMGAGAAWRA